MYYHGVHITSLYEFDNKASEKNNDIIIGGTHTIL